MSEQVTTRVFKGSGYIFARKHSASVSFPKVADMASMTKVEAEAIDAYPCSCGGGQRAGIS